MLFFLAVQSLAQEYPLVELFGGYSALVAGDLDNLSHANDREVTPIYRK
jgi:hypothetical protein